MLEFKGVSKQYLYGDRVLGVLDLTINDGEIISILGDEGSGKTTFIKVASAVTSYEGEILLNGKKITEKTDDTIVIFDDLALFENRSVYYNLAYPLKIRGYTQAEIDKRVKEAAEKLGIYALLYEKVRGIKLIDKKRIALSRLYLRDAKVIYIDDITSNLTCLEEKILFSEFSSIVLEKAKQGVTIVYSTSIKEEAIALADRIVIMHYREIKQIDSLNNIYLNPKNIWAAEAVDENYNFEKAMLKNKDGLKLCFKDIEIDASSLKGKFVESYIDKDIYVGWHGEDVDLSSNRCEEVKKVIKEKDGYVLFTNDKKIISKERLDTVSTIPKIDKVVLYDFLSESSIMKN